MAWRDSALAFDHRWLFDPNFIPETPLPRFYSNMALGSAGARIDIMQAGGT